MEDWLRSIGLGERVPAFVENRITEDQLGDLTEEDLRELGLTIGERKRFLRALQARNETEAPPPEPASPRVAATIQAERRPLTVMFVDLIDSTGLGERLDPEDLLEAIRAYREFCSAAINRFGGRIAQFVGDGILAYFCYPVANENDPERAVRAALAIVDGIGDVHVPAPAPLQVRVGIATGRVVVSELFSDGMSDHGNAVGSIPNLAARLQALAPPNGIVIAHETQARVRRHFTCRALGRTDLRGFEQAHEPFVVTGEAVRPGTGAEASDEAAAKPPTAFSGRESEIEILRALWRKAAGGEDAVVLIAGEAGIGKSRLVQKLCDEVVSEGEHLLLLGASAFHEDSPLRPFIDYIVSQKGILPHERPAEALARLESFLGRSVHQGQAAAIIATLIGIRIDDPAVTSLLPDQLRQRTILTLIEHIIGLDGDTALCVVVEDLHWLDATSRDLLDSLRLHMRGHRMLLVLTTRDEAVASWTGRVDATLRLKRLPPEHVAGMIRSLFGGMPLTPELTEYVASKTDGVPLFVEEVARLLLERATSTSASDAAPTAKSLEQEIPASLDEMLMAVLDRAGPAKELAQVASVIGEVVRRDMLAELSGLGAAGLGAQLAMLVSSGILERELGAPGDRFRFHHALLRDAAYASMVRERRRALHAKAAVTIERLAPDLVTLQPEVLALHLTEGGKVEAAAPHWLEAARRSLARSALTEASSVLRRGLAALERLSAAPGGSTPAVMSLRLQFSALLGPALISLKGPNATETQDLYATAYELGHQLPEEPAHFPIYWGWWRLEMASEERTAALLDRARARGDPGLLLQAHHCCWSSALNRGTLDLCCEHIDAGLAIYGEGDYRQHARLYGNHDAKACAHGQLAQVMWMRGRPSAAMAQERACLGWANELDHLGTRVHALSNVLLHRVYRREHEAVLALSDEMIALTAKHEMAGAGAAALIFRGWAIAGLGEPVAGLRMLEDGWDRQREIATNEDYPVYLCLMAEVLTALGRPAEAVERIRRELDGFERTQLRIWIPELERVLGDTILAADPDGVAEARHHYIRATDLANFQAVPMLALRIALSLAKLDAKLAPDLAARRLADAMAKLPDEIADENGTDLQEARALAGQWLLSDDAN